MEKLLVLLLGSNVGEKMYHIQQANKQLAIEIGEICQQSSIYITAAWGNENQEEFLNQVITISTNKSAEELLSIALKIEEQLGRKRIEKWGPRIIDIDIIYLGNTVIESSTLTIPHPEISNRRFTLIPLVEILPNFMHPKFNKTQSTLLAECKDYGQVSVFKK